MKLEVVAGGTAPPEKWKDDRETSACKRQRTRDRISEQMGSPVSFRGSARRETVASLVSTGRAILLHEKKFSEN